MIRKAFEITQLVFAVILMIEFVSIGSVFSVLMLAFMFINFICIDQLRANQLRIEKANLALYRDFAKRLGWMDIVGDLDRLNDGVE